MVIEKMILRPAGTVQPANPNELVTVRGGDGYGGVQAQGFHQDAPQDVELVYPLRLRVIVSRFVFI